MGMSTAVTSVVSQYATFSGRARRSEFWWWYLAVFIVSAAFAGLAILWGSGTAGTLIRVGYALFSLAILVPTIATATRRLHDRGMAAWWLALFFIPVVGDIVLLVLLALPGDPGPNRYGAAPR